MQRGKRGCYEYGKGGGWESWKLKQEDDKAEGETEDMQPKWL